MQRERTAKERNAREKQDALTIVNGRPQSRCGTRNDAGQQRPLPHIQDKRPWRALTCQLLGTNNTQYRDRLIFSCENIIIANESNNLDNNLFSLLPLWIILLEESIAT